MKNIFFILITLFLSGQVLYGQLNNRVHIWGEVKNPGVYELPAGTSIVDLISVAGGPTGYADLCKIQITHRNEKINIEKINLSKYLGKGNIKSLYIIEDGDVIRIPQNWWYKWRTMITVAADIAIIANVYYWYKNSR
ncbi:MAG: SLBB domain-containing protein [bacterium]|nr:SLBB domain-containing protein [bacterium]